MYICCLRLYNSIEPSFSFHSICEWCYLFMCVCVCVIRRAGRHKCKNVSHENTKIAIVSNHWFECETCRVIDDIFKYILVYTLWREFMVVRSVSSHALYIYRLQHIHQSFERWKFLFKHSAAQHSAAWLWFDGVMVFVLFVSQSWTNGMNGCEFLFSRFLLSSSRIMKREARLVKKKCWNLLKSSKPPQKTKEKENE